MESLNSVLPVTKGLIKDSFENIKLTFPPINYLDMKDCFDLWHCVHNSFTITTRNEETLIWNFIATGNTSLCDCELKHAPVIHVHVVSKKHLEDMFYL